MAPARSGELTAMVTAGAAARTETRGRRRAVRLDASDAKSWTRLRTWCSTRRFSSVARVVRLPGARARSITCASPTPRRCLVVRKERGGARPPNASVAVRALHHPSERAIGGCVHITSNVNPGALRAWADGTGRPRTADRPIESRVRRRRRGGDAQGGAERPLEDSPGAKEMVVGRGHAVLVRTGGELPRRGETGRGVRSRDGGGGKGKERIRTGSTPFAGRRTSSL